MGKYELPVDTYNGKLYCRVYDLRKAADGDCSQVFSAKFTKVLSNERIVRNGENAGKKFMTYGVGAILNNNPLFLQMNSGTAKEFDALGLVEGEEFYFQRQDKSVKVFRNEKSTPKPTVVLPTAPSIDLSDEEKALVDALTPLKDTIEKEKMLDNIRLNLKNFGKDIARAEAIYALL